MRAGVKILLVDDHAMLRDGLRSLLAQQQEMEVVAEAETGRQAVELAEKHLPDIVILDIGMPDMNGLEAARRIKAIDTDIKIIALSMHLDVRYVTGMFEAGARGYLLKTCESEELIRAISAVRRGQTYITPAVGHVVVDSARRAPKDDQPSAKEVLTAKEREVLQLLAEGFTSKEVAAKLDMAVRTAETHRGNIMEKLDLHSVAELTKYAIREGITSL